MPGAFDEKLAFYYSSLDLLIMSFTESFSAAWKEYLQGSDTARQSLCLPDKSIKCLRLLLALTDWLKDFCSEIKFAPPFKPPTNLIQFLKKLDYATSKIKRHTEKSLDPLSPINPNVYPTHFGALNISWDPPAIVLRSQISHYEVLLRNLTNPLHIRRRICSYYKLVIPESDSEISTTTRIVVSLSSSLDGPHLQLTEMLPDTFYSVEVRTVLSNGTVSQPTELPSSPLVPAAPPSGHPIHVSIFSTIKNRLSSHP
ncbi:hypothetical protein ACTXT7_003306 [Hymenolepis weldensis]